MYYHHYQALKHIFTVNRTGVLLYIGTIKCYLFLSSRLSKDISNTSDLSKYSKEPYRDSIRTKQQNATAKYKYLQSTQLKQLCTD